MAFYIGIDGGGTKTQYALFNEKKEMLSSVKTTGSNHENLEGAIPEAAGIIIGGINELLKENELEQKGITHILMALAGIDHDYQCEEMTKELKKLGLDVPFSIYNDGFIVVKAGITGKAGIGYNCGTATCCNSVGSDGKLLQVGGFSELSGDVGGGHWIAKMTFRKLYDEVCLKLGHTQITDGFVEKFKISPDRNGVLSLIVSLEEADDAVIRDILDIYFDALNADDSAAVEIADEMALRGAQFICAHIKSQRFDDEVIQVVLSGSMHCKLPSDKYIEKLEKKTEELSGRKLEFIKLNAPPVTGCINWMLEA